MSSASEKEPKPIANTQVCVADFVRADIEARIKMGEAKHGTKLQPHNGRKPLWDAYQEVLDLVMYLRQEIIEREALEARIAELEAEVALFRELVPEEETRYAPVVTDTQDCRCCSHWVHRANTNTGLCHAQGLDSCCPVAGCSAYFPFAVIKL